VARSLSGIVMQVIDKMMVLRFSIPTRLNQQQCKLPTSSHQEMGREMSLKYVRLVGGCCQLYNFKWTIK